MIKYPRFKEKGTIGVSAPSSGVPEYLHSIIKSACERMVEKGFKVICGETVWTQKKAKSAPAEVRAEELNKMMQDVGIDMIIPPWGGELLIEMLEYLDFDRMEEKWILGYSDVSALLFATTLQTGMATAHGTNLIDLRGEYSDSTTAMWKTVLSTNNGEEVLQHSSEKFQRMWNHDEPSPYVFHLTEPTYWKTVSADKVELRGRLLGGCIDILMHLVGTPYGDVRQFRERFIHGDPVIWFLENVHLNTTGLRRALVQMKLAGWFENCSGIMFGRSAANDPVDDYEIEDVYRDLSEELQVPVIYDIDCGHMPPQMTFINGAFAEVVVKDGKGTVVQRFV